MKKKEKKQIQITSIQAETSPETLSHLLLFLLMVFVFFVFFSARGNEFVVWDDQRYVFRNDLITNPTISNFFRLFDSVVLLNYHPITMISLWLNSFFFGMKPASFIITNILIHTANTYLIYLFAYKLSPKNFWISYLSALIWAIHPMHVESVIWVSERKDVLYTFFFLLACLAYLKGNHENKKWLFLTYLFFILSCLSKPMAIVLPVVLLLIDYWQGKNMFSWQIIKPKISFFLISIFFFWISFNSLSNGDFYGIFEKIGTSQQVTENDFSFFERISFGANSLWIYVVKLIVPIRLHHWYIFPEKTLLVYTSISIFIILAYILFYSYKRNKIIFFGVSFFLVNIILVLQIFPVSIVFLAERYSYLAYFGLIFMVLFILSKVFQQKVLISFSIIISLIFSYLSFQQIKIWKNTTSLWANNFKYHPNHSETAVALINRYRAENNQDKALETAEIAIKAGLKDASVYYGTANLYMAKEDYQKALENLNLAQNTVKNENLELQKTIFMSKAAVFNWLAQPDSSIIYLKKMQNIQIPK